MGISDFFKNKMPVVQFDAVEPVKVTPEEFREGLQTYSFKDELGLELSYGFVDFDDPYGSEPQFRDHAHVFGTFFAGAVRFDKKSVPTSAVKREVEKACDKFKQDTGAKFISRGRKKEIKEQVTAAFFAKVPAKTTFTPFVVDMSTGKGYYYSTSKKEFDLFESLLERAYGTAFKLHENDEVGEDFLTFVWWDSESNSFVDMSTGNRLTKTFVGDRISVLAEDQKITVVGDIEEAKLSISKGANVTKMEMLVHIGEDERKFVVNSANAISGLTYSDDMLPEDESEELTPYIQATKDIFDVLALWKARYLEAQERGSGLTQNIRKTWGRGTYCSRPFDDI